ncbi:hypothetical protein D3C87_1448680 [compost metagenome]
MPGQPHRAGKQRIGCGVVNGQIRASPVEHQIEAAGHRHDPARSAEIQRAGQGPVGQTRERRDAVGLDLDIAVEIGAIDLAGQVCHQRRANHAQFGQLDRLAGIPQPGKPQPNAVAQRRLDARIGVYAGKGPFAVEGHHAA